MEEKNIQLMSEEEKLDKLMRVFANFMIEHIEEEHNKKLLQLKNKSNIISLEGKNNNGTP